MSEGDSKGVGMEGQDTMPKGLFEAQFRVSTLPGPAQIGSNRVYVHPDHISGLSEVFILVGEFVYLVEGHAKMEPFNLGMNAVQRRDCKVSSNMEMMLVQYQLPSTEKKAYLGSIAFEIEPVTKGRYPVDGVDAKEVLALIHSIFNRQVLTYGQSIVMDYQGTNMMLKVLDMLLADGSHAPSGLQRGLLVPSTVCTLGKPQGSLLNLFNVEKSRTVTSMFKKMLDFESLGIGGLDKEFSEIFRRAFASRIFPPDIIKKLQVHHVKGILLYGPPGTGKTLIARQIGKMLNCREPKVVNGPEILSKYVGESEKHVRELFAEAEEEQKTAGDESGLHLIIFDEIDAITRSRGTSRDGTGVHDSIVNQLLSKIDGVDALNNVLIIGMTNRRDMLDEALLRPGRFEVQVEIGLPDEVGRQQIFRIHTKPLREASFLDVDVDLDILASKTKNYSGAEIEGVVKSAQSFAFSRQVDMKNPSKPINADDLMVTSEDFDSALQEVHPAFGVDQDDFEVFLRDGLIHYGRRFEHLWETVTTFAKQLHMSQRTNLLSVLLEGPRGSGKTTLAAHAAFESGYPFVKIISPEQMVGFSEPGRASRIAKVFDDAYKSPMSVIVLDNIERLIDYVDIGPRFSNPILQTIMILLKKRPKLERKLLIIGTTSHADILRPMEMLEAFNVVVHVPSLADLEDMRNVLVDTELFEPSDIDAALKVMPPTIGIKQLMLVIEMAQSKSPEGSKVSVGHFQQCLFDCGCFDPSLAKDPSETF
uniref:Vesicle-fusing ATPase n=1 Tax=Stygiella incarcerata TaxID=1712417 RepID=A0A192ZIC3_9EUKA|nr:vesicle-fusing ATPase NSF [Stygiella incarcerata]